MVGLRAPEWKGVLAPPQIPSLDALSQISCCSFPVHKMDITIILLLKNDNI
jgi:hypothetical protein